MPSIFQSITTIPCCCYTHTIYYLAVFQHFQMWSVYKEIKLTHFLRSYRLHTMMLFKASVNNCQTEWYCTLHHSLTLSIPLADSPTPVDSLDSFLIPFHMPIQIAPDDQSLLCSYFTRLNSYPPKKTSFPPHCIQPVEHMHSRYWYFSPWKHNLITTFVSFALWTHSIPILCLLYYRLTCSRLQAPLRYHPFTQTPAHTTRSSSFSPSNLLSLYPFQSLHPRLENQLSKCPPSPFSFSFLGHASSAGDAHCSPVALAHLSEGGRRSCALLTRNYTRFYSILIEGSLSSLDFGWDFNDRMPFLIPTLPI